MSKKQKYAFVLGASSMLAVAAAMGGIYLAASDDSVLRERQNRRRERKQQQQQQQQPKQLQESRNGSDKTEERSAQRALLERVFKDLSNNPHIQYPNLRSPQQLSQSIQFLTVTGFPSGQVAAQCLAYCELQEIVVCLQVCKSWNMMATYLMHDKRFVRRCARRGFRKEWRARCYQLITGSHELQYRMARSFHKNLNDDDQLPRRVEQKHPISSSSASKVSMYNYLSHVRGSDYEDAIAGDIGRTLVHHEAFRNREREGDETVRRVLRAYSNHDPEVGYCQGMNFVAGFLLTIFPNDEEQAYWLFYTIMNAEHYAMRFFFNETLYGLHVAKYQFQNLLSLYLPDLFAHLEQLHFGVDVIVTEWFMTIFCHVHIPNTYTERIWDLYVVDGFKALHRVGLAILFLLKPQLLHYDFEQCFSAIRNFATHDIMLALGSSQEQQADRLVKQAMAFKVTNRMLLLLGRKYDRMSEEERKQQRGY